MGYTKYAMWKKNKIYIVSIISLISVTLLLLNFSTPFLDSFKTSPKNYQIGSVEDLTGKVEILRANQLRPVLASEADPLYENDVIITHTDSKTQLLFRPTFWLMPHSKIELVKTKTGIEGRLIYGELKKTVSKKNYKAQNISLTYNDALITDNHFSTFKDTTLNNLAPINTTVDFDELSQAKTRPDNLIEKQIFQTLALHKRFFQSCLIRHYKKNKGQLTGGETVFSMMIQPNGDIEKIRVTKSETKNQDYENCLTEVLARVRFKNLKIDEPLPAVFPLNIEL